MLDIVKTIIINVLTAFYPPFLFALTLSIFIIYFMLNAEEHGIKNEIKKFIQHLKNDKEEWLTFALVFYAVQILFRTLYNRYWFTNPVSNVFGTWGFYTEKNGEMVLTTEVPENIILFLPFIILLFIRYKEKIFGEKVLLGKVIWQSIKIAFISSFIIESLQLFLRLGTWQLSDLAFNTLGGLIGGLVYWIGYKVKHRESKR